MTRKELANNKATQALKLKLDQEYGIPRLMKRLWRDIIKFPVLVYGWARAEVSFVETLEAYIDEYSWKWLTADYILDSDGKRYITKSKTGKELALQIPELEDHKFEQVEATWDIKSFQEIKSQVIESIETHENKWWSCYSQQKSQIEKATSVREIVYALKKWDY